MKIMIIDDEDSMRHMLSVILKREGYEPQAYQDAKKALSALDSEDFDFILCDIKMPGMDGLEFLKALREKGAPQTVIMMSAYGTIDTAVECMKLGAYDYISKPFKADEIILTVKKAEERERLKRENTRLKSEVYRDYDFKKIITEDKREEEKCAIGHFMDYLPVIFYYITLYQAVEKVRPGLFQPRFGRSDSVPGLPIRLRFYATRHYPVIKSPADSPSSFSRQWQACR